MEPKAPFGSNTLTGLISSSKLSTASPILPESLRLATSANKSLSGWRFFVWIYSFICFPFVVYSYSFLFYSYSFFVSWFWSSFILSRARRNTWEASSGKVWSRSCQFMSLKKACFLISCILALKFGSVTKMLYNKFLAYGFIFFGQLTFRLNIFSKVVYIFELENGLKPPMSSQSKTPHDQISHSRL